MKKTKHKETGKPMYEDVKPTDLMKDLKFHKVPGMIKNDRQWALHTNLGSLTVLDRLTGFDWRDIETGLRLPGDDKFWLASGGHDVRFSGCETIEEAFQWVKERANTCVPIEEKIK